MRLFPLRKHDPLKPNAQLQQALDQAIASTPQTPTGAPIAIVAIDPLGPPHPFAERRGAEVHYSASLMKVAAMYAAFELRSAGRELIEELHLAPADVFSTFRSKFDEVLRKDRVPQLASLAEGYLLPAYEELFSVHPATSKLDFSQDCLDDLAGAISKGSNESAANLIHSLGFGYVTKALAEAGFLNPSLTKDPAKADSIWLAGDFGFGFPAQRIPAVNDTPTAQGTSARQMAKLFTLLFDEKLVRDDDSDEAMQKLLKGAVGKGLFWLNKEHLINYFTQQSKIGNGPVNIGPSPKQVASEALVIQENNSTRFFVVVFQNVRLVQDPDSVFPISRIVDKTIAAFH